MLYEIYQLKTSLNIDDENDEDYEHLANYIYSKRFSANSKPKPPTPPKVLDDNKVTEKLRHYELLMDKQPAIWTTKKNVQLVDANPEIIISERDILQTLIETNVEPNQAERICRTLFHKSKDTTSCQMVGNVSWNLRKLLHVPLAFERLFTNNVHDFRVKCHVEVREQVPSRTGNHFSWHGVNLSLMHSHVNVNLNHANSN